MAERAVVVIPTYNERVNLPLIVPQVLQQDPIFDVLVVDDNSPDGTGRLADELAAAFKGKSVRVLVTFRGTTTASKKLVVRGRAASR